ncbi:hypothetical protein BKA56DRAFT_719120 [Ilyonectria sp. MPI-CAGE-AT-0026]|nr:hypothetical protein BKA56DRAFT_719120 [Ilyonectria sp. MPI-CAGE-AT-0026]
MEDFHRLQQRIIGHEHPDTCSSVSALESWQANVGGLAEGERHCTFRAHAKLHLRLMTTVYCGLRLLRAPPSWTPRFGDPVLVVIIIPTVGKTQFFLKKTVN